MTALARSLLTAILFAVACVGASLVGQLGLSGPAHAHALQPGYLEIRLIDDGAYAVTWKVPVVSGRPMPIVAQLPDTCDQREPPGALAWDGVAYVTRWTTQCPAGLEGGTVGIDGLDRTRTDVLVRFDFNDGATQTQRLTADATSFTVPAQPSGWEVVGTYFPLGVEHILSGLDHLLFVLALLILVRGGTRIVATVTSFTIAHSITLAGATLGLVHLPSVPVEAAIALSIVFVASEIMHSRAGRPGLTERYPWVVAFTFGLLHGFGFAGALTEIGLPPNAIPLSLLFFNLGVEVGQLLFVAAVFAAMAVYKWIDRQLTLPRPRWAGVILPYLIGSLAAFWFIQRVALF